jgi:hypothetical protein
MALALVHTRARCGVRAPEVRVEVFMAGGLPQVTIAGLAGTVARESRERIRSNCLANCRCPAPCVASVARCRPPSPPVRRGAR